MPCKNHLSRRLVAAAVTVGAVIALAACSSSSKGGSSADEQGAAKGLSPNLNIDQCGKDTRTIKHAFGSTTVKGTPSRVVVLEGSFADALVGMGMSPVGVADDDKKDFLLPELRAKMQPYTSVGLRATPNLQVISSLKPDLIIADSQRHKPIYGQLTKIAPTVAYPSLRASYQQILDSDMLIAETVNKCSQMRQRLDDHAATMATFKKDVPASESRKVLFAVTYDKGFNAHTAYAYTPSVLQAIGLPPVLKPGNGDAYADMTLESLVTAKPDIMFLAYNTPKTVSDGWQSNALWKDLPAVKNHMLFKVDSFVWSKNRGLVSAELIAKEAVKDLYGNDG
jgi:ferric citrate transport system substrate-binding protein